ncbi:MAG: Na(+)/H(+) antiporter NhaA [Syntrophaceae bacterium PtaU1.Bin231]|nr:MAG: Na(+)/H(+) antiporter NhaA [Syntrophaceae bacterium PtaU1.Bin231]
MRRYPLEPLFEKILSPFERFLRQTTAGGVVLMVATVLTLVLANSPWGAFFRQFWDQPFRLEFGGRFLEMPLRHWINDGLMTFFFLLVGLELKREVMVGELSSPKDAILPVAGALGGMIVPGVIYVLLNPSGPAAAGWGIPMATDIAFAVGILVLLSWRIPRSLIVFLTALAIADDIGAVLVIAFFYTTSLDGLALGAAAVLLALLILLNRGGVRRSLPYGILGVLLWVALLRSGIHATIAGVLLAFTIPARPVFSPGQFDFCLTKLQGALHAEATGPEMQDHPLSDPRMSVIAQNVESVAKAVQSPQQLMEHAIGNGVTFFIIPLFAFANAGVDFAEIRVGEVLAHPVTLGVVLGLVLGKFLGISGAAWLAAWTGIAQLPSGVGWRQFCGIAWLGGIGFTMSLFISELAFHENPLLREEAKVGILLSSVLAAAIGLVWLFLSSPRRRS